jgi:hypothetical protein
MTAIRDLINKLREDSYYVRLMEILVINGLLDIFEEEIRDGKIDYLPLVLNLIKFLEKNKKHYRNFSSDTFESIIILSIDEIINKKFQINLEEEQLKMVLELVKNSYLFKSTITFMKDFLIKMYYKCKCKSCYSSSDVIIELDKSRHPTV